MARSKKQYENEIRTIVVGKVAAGLKKARFVERVIAGAKKNDMVVDGHLTNPEGSNSIIPKSDDKWLLDRDSVYVEVDKVDELTGLPVHTLITVELEYGLSKEYYYLSYKSPVKAWRPNGWEIKRWVQFRMDSGSKFTVPNRRKPGELIPARNTPGDRDRVAYLLSKRLERQGHNKTTLGKEFDQNGGVERVLQKAFDQALARVAELYGEAIDNAFASATFDLI